ncbi:MAG: methyltransferase domain-containing protein [Anaerolineales bacterium]|nr:methyltransferase domain-containing protein [Anaerolineales bacterium]
MTKDFLWLHLRELPYFRSILRAVEARFFQEVAFPRPLLDFGCGDGHFASVALEAPVDFGVDLHLPSLREAQRRGNYRVVVQSDGGRMPFANESIAGAFSNSVLEHLPQLKAVLAEIRRILRRGAPLVFTVPNPGYKTELSVAATLRRLRLGFLAEAYEDWFMWMSRTRNLLYEEDWESVLSEVGFSIERTFRYFPPASLRALEWGHYFGAPCLLPRWVAGRWILVPTRWNLFLTDFFVRRYSDPRPSDDGTYSFYMVRKP